MAHDRVFCEEVEVRKTRLKHALFIYLFLLSLILPAFFSKNHLVCADFLQSTSSISCRARPLLGDRDRYCPKQAGEHKLKHTLLNDTTLSVKQNRDSHSLKQTQAAQVGKTGSEKTALRNTHMILENDNLI